VGSWAIPAVATALTSAGTYVSSSWTSWAVRPPAQSDQAFAVAGLVREVAYEAGAVELITRA